MILDSSNKDSPDLSSSNIIADVQNVYNEKDEYMYVASNSLPKYEITKKKSYSSFGLTPSTTISNHFKGYDSGTNQYSILGFDSNVPFITGDEIVYTSSGSDNVISGLKLNEVYHVEVIKDGNNTNTIRLYDSKSFIGTTKYFQFDAYYATSTHMFTLRQHSGRSLAPKKALAKIPLVPNIQSGTDTGLYFQSPYSFNKGQFGYFVPQSYSVNYQYGEQANSHVLPEIQTKSQIYGNGKGDGYAISMPEFSIFAGADGVFNPTTWNSGLKYVSPDGPL